MNPNMPEKGEGGVGVVGMGLMGRGLALSLIRAGKSVSGFDAYGEASETAASAGIPQASRLDEIARLSTIVLALPDSPDVEEVVRELLATTESGTLIIDCSTIDPAVTTALAAEAAATGVRFRDAGMGGGPNNAAEGTLLFMVGCPQEEWREIEDFLAPISRAVVRCGDTGSGVTLKVINNLLALSVFLADVEVLLLAGKAGLELEPTLEVLKSTGAANAAFDGLVARQYLPRQFDGAFRTSLARKDVAIALQVAARLGIQVPNLAPTLDIFSQAVDDGLGGMAAGAAGLVLDRLAGQAETEPGSERDTR